MTGVASGPRGGKARPCRADNSTATLEGPVPTEALILFAALAGSFGTLAVIAVGVRCTRNLRSIGWGGICSGATLGVLAYFSLGWFAHGVEPLQLWILPFAGLALLLVMVAQNWFVFYEDREDFAQSARPTLVLLAAAAALALVAHLGEWRAAAQLMICAGAASAVLVLSIHPVHRSIAANGSLAVGLLVGTAKLLVPSRGVVVLLAIDWAVRHRPTAKSRRTIRRDPSADADTDADADPEGFAVNLLLLIWEFAQLLLVGLTNGARFVPHPGLSDTPSWHASHRRAQTAAGQMRLSKRNAAILMLVMALHLLCCLVLVRN